MNQSRLDDAKILTESSLSCLQPLSCTHCQCSSKQSDANIYQVLAWREISPQAKHSSKKLWKGSVKQTPDGFWQKCGKTDARQAIFSWVEAESLRHLSAKYCPLLPPPRSTIAAAFSSDGKKLASTHGDHTVKIIDCNTGKCLKVLTGHRRTPWVVRFHPLCPEILASGSLDHEVRLWDARTATCIGSQDFNRPIASIAFHARGELLAVASGHKLFIWSYNKIGQESSPAIVLKTRRSLRAVHFHPHGAPLLLTAEVNDLDSSDSPLTVATSPGFLHYPYPGSFPHLGNSQNPEVDVSVSGQQSGYASTSQQSSHGDPTPMDISSSEPAISFFSSEDAIANSLLTVRQMVISDSDRDNFQSNDAQRMHQQSQADLGSGGIDGGQLLQFNPYPACWQLPFLQGWLMGRTSASFHVQGNPSSTRARGPGALPTELLYSQHVDALVASSAITNATQSRIRGRSTSRHRSRPRRLISTGTGEATANVQRDDAEGQTIGSSFQAEISKSMAAAAAAELPCTVKLRVWPYDIQDPCALLDADNCLLTIPHAVLCSEMGAHFSPCGRFLAACVACLLPNGEGDIGQSHMQLDASAAGTSPTRHPITAHQVMYELRIYSLEGPAFGSILASRPIRAAHCLTSIQFSPTSEHILLAYGRRHSSLLRSFLVEGETTVPIYTILEIYRVSDMEPVRVLPSAEDEVNVACFHPLIGGGLVYGTKEGKLRILQVDGSHTVKCTGSSTFLEDSEVQKYAIEC